MKPASLVSAFALVLLSTPASAVDFNFTTCEVLEVVSHGPQNVHMQLSCNLVNAPACAVAVNYFGFDASSVEGKRYFAMAMMAQATGATVTGLVEQSCSPYQGNVALLSHLRLNR